MHKTKGRALMFMFTSYIAYSMKEMYYIF